MPSLELILLVLSSLFFISILISKAGTRFGVPVLLIFLGVGMLFGSDGAGLQFRNLDVAQGIGTFALCIILFSGGLDTKINDIKPIIKQGITLATVGVLITALVTGVFIWLVVGKLLPGTNLSLLESLLLASIMSSTDSASVFAVLRSKGISLKNNLRPLLELESGSNDPMAYMLTITLIQLIIADKTPGVLHVIALLAVQLIVGGLLGYLLGKLAVRIINHINLANDSLYPVLLLTFSILIFSISYFMKGNGFLAVYVGGLVIGNSRFIMKRTSVKFFDGFAWLSQIAMFLTLGLLVNPKELIPVAFPSILIALFMICAGRPVSVFLSMMPFKIGFKDKLFLSWVGLRGAVPVVFAILPLTAGVKSGWFMFNIVFFITLISLFIQGSSIAVAADKLGLSDETVSSTKLQNFDLELGEDIKSILSEAIVTEDDLANGTKLLDMSLPKNTLVLMVKRGGKYFVPRGNTEIEPNDIMLMISDKLQ